MGLLAGMSGRHQPKNGRGNGKALSVHAMNAYGGSEGIAAVIFNVDTRSR